MPLSGRLSIELQKLPSHRDEIADEAGAEPQACAPARFSKQAIIRWEEIELADGKRTATTMPIELGGGSQRWPTRDGPAAYAHTLCKVAGLRI
jgi:hypothetical protein